MSKELFVAMDNRDMTAMYARTFDARDEAEKLRSRVGELEGLVASLTERVALLEHGSLDAPDYWDGTEEDETLGGNDEAD